MPECSCQEPFRDSLSLCESHNDDEVDTSEIDLVRVAETRVGARVFAQRPYPGPLRAVIYVVRHVFTAND